MREDRSFIGAPIGVIHTQHRVPEETPIQPAFAMNCPGWLEVLPEYAEGLKNLEGFSHIVLLYYFHQTGPPRLTVRPFVDDTPRGVFSTRHPQRPNPIGLSVVRLTRMEGTRLYMEGMDILDGTPLLDIKPYIPKFDCPENVRDGWFGGVDEKTVQRRGRRMRKKPQGWLSFSLMSLAFYFRDLLHPPVKILQEAGLASGATVLDFGCGPGAFSVAAAGIVGPGGKVFAVDVNPLALAAVHRTVEKKQLCNVTLLSPADLLDIPEGTVDMVIMYDVLHDVPDPPAVLASFYRLLKPEGLLTVSDHHMIKTAIFSAIQSNGLFEFSNKWHGQTGYYCFRRAAHG